MNTLGIVTIGQAPRTDIGLSFGSHFDPLSIAIIQRGAVDGLTDEYIRSTLAPVGDEETYVTKLQSGVSVELAKKRIVPLLQERIDELEVRCDAIVVVCTGDFPMLTSAVTLYLPDQLLVQAARERGISGALGLVVPLARQAADIARKWDALGVPVHTAVATPYGDSDLASAAVDLAAHSPSLIVLDCMGYTATHGETVRHASGGEVVVPQDFIPAYVAQQLAENE